jgi:hypothetical protein
VDAVDVLGAQATGPVAGIIAVLAPEVEVTKKHVVVGVSASPGFPGLFHSLVSNTTEDVAATHRVVIEEALFRCRLHKRLAIYVLMVEPRVHWRPALQLYLINVGPAQAAFFPVARSVSHRPSASSWLMRFSRAR